MFSVFGVSGQLFRGSLDQLRQVGGVAASQRSRRVAAVGREGDDANSAGSFGSDADPHGSPDKGARSVLAAYAQTQQPHVLRHPLRAVQDIMSRTVIVISDAAKVDEAWRTLARHRVGQAPVVNAHGVLVGLLLRADLLQVQQLPGPDAHALAWRALLMQPVTALMETPVPSVEPQAEVRHVARVLLDSGLPGLPVVDDTGLVQGFVSRTDILRSVVAEPPLDLWG
jgi:CBS domain-containing protein